MHISTTLQQINTDETNAACILFPSTDGAAPHLYVKSVILCGVSTQAYSVYDARGVIPPYVSANPVIAVNMAAGMVVDFNGGPNLSSAPGNYLQYTTSGGNRLRYMVGATERFTLPDTKPTVTGAKGGNAALASLLTALAAANLVTDSTSA